MAFGTCGVPHFAAAWYCTTAARAVDDCGSKMKIDPGRGYYRVLLWSPGTTTGCDFLRRFETAYASTYGGEFPE